MNFIVKIVKSWWVILSFIMFLNGIGFIYIGTKHSNHNWIIEGIIYEIPWFFFAIFLAIYGIPTIFSPNPSTAIILFAVLLMFVSIIRSFWLAIKLANLYDTNEMYA